MDSCKDAESGYTHIQKPFPLAPLHQSAMEEAALEEREPANSKEVKQRLHRLEALDWMTSEIRSHFRTLGFQDFRTSRNFISS